MYRLTWLALILAIGMTLLSAWIRLSDSGIGCTPWPACFTAQVIIDQQPGVTIAGTDAHRGLRMLHRMMASGFALVVMVMTIAAFWYRGRISLSPVLPVLCLILTLILAVVGMNTPDVVHPVVTGINLTGGMLLAALLWQLVLMQRQRSVSGLNARNNTGGGRLIAWLTGGAIIVAAVTIASGAWVSANFAAGACEGVLRCGSMAQAEFAEAFDLRRELTVNGSGLTLGADQALTGWAHHWLAMLTALLVFGLGVMIVLKRGADLTAFTLAGLMAALTLVGMLETGHPTVLSAWLHNLLSLSLLLLLVYQFNRTQPIDPKQGLP